MTYNEFFRQATLKNCGNLNIEESIFLTRQFLEKRMPVTIMFLEYYDVTLSSTRTVAKATPEGGKQVDLLTPLSPMAKNRHLGILKILKTGLSVPGSMAKTERLPYLGSMQANCVIK